MPKVKNDKLFGEYTCACHLHEYLKSIGYVYEHQSRPSIDCLLNSSSHIHHKHFKYVIWKSFKAGNPGRFFISYQVFRPDLTSCFITLKTYHHELIFDSNKNKLYSSNFYKFFKSFEELKIAIQESEHRQIKWHGTKIKENLFSASAAVRRNIFKPLPTFEEYKPSSSYKICEHNKHYKQSKRFSSSEEEDETVQQTDNGSSSSRGLAVVEFRPLVVR
jgi:hypothetical protein